MTKYRIAFVRDEDARFEESNGEERPLTEAEYKGSEYRACPIHPRSKKPPKRIKAGLAWCGECGEAYQDIPYPEYLAYYGNPARHLYIGTVVEAQTGVEDWKDVASLWGSDFMDDDPALERVQVTKDRTGQLHYYPVSVAVKLPGYFGELAREVLAEAKANVGKGRTPK